MRPITVALVFAFCAVPIVAHAQNKSPSTDAEKLFDEGKALMKAHEVAEACSKFEQSDKLDPGVGNGLWLGDCYERSGKLESAYTQFSATEKLAASLQDPRDAIAHKRAAALLPKLSKPEVTPPPVASAVDNAVDNAVANAVVHDSITIAPATHRVEAPAVPTSKAPELTPDLVAARSPLRIAAPITVAVGLLGLGLGTAFEVLAQGNRNDSSSHCPIVCDAQGAQLRQNAFTADVGSAVSLITGGLLVATGATMMLVTPLTKFEKFAFAPAVSPTFAGFVGQGRF